MNISYRFKEHDIIRIVDGNPCYWYPNYTSYLHKVLHKLHIAEVIQMPEPLPYNNNYIVNSNDTLDVDEVASNCSSDDDLMDISIKINKQKYSNQKYSKQKYSKQKYSNQNRKTNKIDHSKNKHTLFNRQKGLDEKEFTLDVGMVKMKQQFINQIEEFEKQEEEQITSEYKKKWYNYCSCHYSFRDKMLKQHCLTCCYGSFDSYDYYD
jgi:hypothetical protein